MSDAFNVSGQFDANGNLIPGSVSSTVTPLSYSTQEINAINNAIGGSQYSATPKPSIPLLDPTKSFALNPFGLGDELQKEINTIGNVVGAVPKVASAATTAVNILTDIPRLVTIIGGLILLLVGLFMLGAKPAVQIVGKAKETGEAIAALAA